MLEEVTFMDASLIFTPTQTILVWTLLSLLLIWMVTFTVLALRSHDTVNLEHLSTSSSPLPIIRVESQLQVITFNTSIESSPGSTISDRGDDVSGWAQTPPLLYTSVEQNNDTV